MKTVFILGAGASAEAGAPLMGNFLQMAKKLHASGAYGQDSDTIEDVLTAASEDIKSVLAKASFNHRNIEELFSAIDIGAVIGRYGSRKPSEIDRLRNAICTFIFRTIEETIKIPCNSGRIGLPKGYDTLMGVIKEEIIKGARNGKKSISFISFNYDPALEFSLVRSGFGVDYGLPSIFLNNDENRYQVSVPVYKLHGSINWAYCDHCKEIHPVVVDQWRRASSLDMLDASENLKFAMGSLIARSDDIHSSCGNPWRRLPVIVPPTWNKGGSEFPELRGVWKKAADELAQADNIIVIGYSFPVSDTFFKYLFALGCHGPSWLDKFVVVNGPSLPNNSQTQDTLGRFRGMLGNMTQDNLESHDFLFSGAGAVIRSVLNG